MNNSGDAAGGGLLALLLGGPALLVLILLYVAVAYSLMTIANKLSIPNSWLAWIPFANIYLMVQCAGLELWWIIVCLVPYVNVIGFIYVWWKICERRGKPGPLALLMLVPCVNIGLPIYIAMGD